MDDILNKEFNFATNFFDTAIKHNKLFHAYLLTGNNNIAKYALIMNIARILNCTGDKSEKCTCLNCKWIRENSHPAVMTFSPIDFIHVNDNKKAKENITVAQAEYIKEELSKTSTYHRVLIITNAQEHENFTEECNELKRLGTVPPKNIGDTAERVWMPKSLSKNILTTETANALLKTIEEPFEHVTFFFIANSVEDLIPTIVSRCQIVNIPSVIKTNNNFDLIKKIADNYPPKDNLTAIYISDYIKKIAKENGMEIIEILNILESFYAEDLSSDCMNLKNYRNVVTFLNKIEIAKTQLERHCNVDSVLENLFFL